MTEAICGSTHGRSQPRARRIERLDLRDENVKPGVLSLWIDRFYASPRGNGKASEAGGRR